jgi:hypothetical protein
MRENISVCGLGVRWVITLTHAGFPDAKARSSAG